MNEITSILQNISTKDILEFADALIRVPSNPGEEKEISQVLSSLMKEVGCSGVQVDDLWNVYGFVGDVKSKSLLLGSHTDAPHPGSMTNPFEPKVMDGSTFGKKGQVIRGRGAVAPKGHLAAILASMKALSSANLTLKKGLIIAGYSRDLMANHDGIKRLCEHPEVSISAAVVGEASDNCIVMGARGRVEFDVELKGRVAHAGNPHKGVNALEKAGRLLLELKKVKLPLHDKLGEGTMTPIDIQCKVVRPSIPDLCTVTFDRRILPQESPEGVKGQIDGICSQISSEDQEFQFEVRLKRAMYPFEVTDDGMVKLMKEAGELATGQQPGIMYSRSFSTNAGYLQKVKKIPSIGFGPGRIEDMSEDHVEVSKLVEAARMYATIAILYSEKG